MAFETIQTGGDGSQHHDSRPLIMLSGETRTYPIDIMTPGDCKYLKDDHWYMAILKLTQYRVLEMLRELDKLLTTDYRNGTFKTRLTELVFALVEFYPDGHGDSYDRLLQFAANLWREHPEPFTRCLCNEYSFLEPDQHISQYSELGETNDFEDPIDFLDHCFTLGKIGHLVAVRLHTKPIKAEKC